MKLGAVLVVEDDEDVASCIVEALETIGLRGYVAVNGAEALEALRESRPSLILLDLMMPVMDGWQFRQEQRRLPEVADIPLMVMTADGHAEAKARALDAAGYVAKPVTLDTLLAEVQRVYYRVAPQTSAR